MRIGLGDARSLIAYLLAMVIAVSVFIYVLGLAPLRADGLTTIGVFVGIVLDIVMYPTVGGFDRNLFPIEIGSYTILGAVVTFSSGFLVIRWRRNSGDRA